MLLPFFPRSLAALAATLLAGCSTIGEPPHDWLLLPTAAVAAVSNGYVTIPGLAAGVAVYAVLDPLAPNWSLQEARLGEERYRLVLRMKAVHSGGAGEAHQIFIRRAEQLAGQPGFAAYEVTRWQEGIESNRPFAQRVAYGDIRLVRSLPPLAAKQP
ncbi:hypothetical protein [Zoogloea sp.]|uniref:hypothetical protein n=1 Tax=Zoogloea sp. TaxID=49181 RepID=UPI001415EF4A|nr:MAG: hypothetical protein F9K15_06715 [Zoogloea sp.]